MKIAVISDIHGNIEALESVIRDAKECGVEDFFCLGDIVGYGPYPKECLDRVRGIANVIVKGNHEDGTSRPEAASRLSNPNAAAGMLFSHAALPPEDIIFIRDLPETANPITAPVALAHGAFTHPRMWKYIETDDEILPEFQAFTEKVGLLGHTHVPFVYGERSGFALLTPGSPIPLAADDRYLINIGSVGQPRDEDNRASYGILEVDAEGISYESRRVEYDIKKTAQAIREAGLPSFLAERLFLGN